MMGFVHDWDLFMIGICSLGFVHDWDLECHTHFRILGFRVPGFGCIRIYVYWDLECQVMFGIYVYWDLECQVLGACLGFVFCFFELFWDLAKNAKPKTP